MASAIWRMDFLEAMLRFCIHRNASSPAILRRFIRTSLAFSTSFRVSSSSWMTLLLTSSSVLWIATAAWLATAVIRFNSVSVKSWGWDEKQLSTPITLSFLTRKGIPSIETSPSFLAISFSLNRWSFRTSLTYNISFFEKT